MEGLTLAVYSEVKNKMEEMVITIFPIKFVIKPTKNGYKVLVLYLDTNSERLRLIFDGGYQNIDNFIKRIDKQINKEEIFATIDVYDKHPEEDKLWVIEQQESQNPMLPTTRNPDVSYSYENKDGVLKYLRDYFFADIALNTICSEVNKRNLLEKKVD